MGPEPTLGPAGEAGDARAAAGRGAVRAGGEPGPEGPGAAATEADEAVRAGGEPGPAGPGAAATEADEAVRAGGEPGPAGPGAAATEADKAAMGLAIAEARRALEHDDVPVGAVILGPDGQVLGRGHNERERLGDPSAHAEMLAIREAAARIGHWRLLDTTLYVTLEPCAMCAGAIVLARIPRVVYGTHDPKAGAAGSVLDVLAEPRLNHRPQVTRGVRQPECAALLVDFFAAKRRGSLPSPVARPEGCESG